MVMFQESISSNRINFLHHTVPSKHTNTMIVIPLTQYICKTISYYVITVLPLIREHMYHTITLLGCKTSLPGMVGRFPILLRMPMDAIILDNNFFIFNYNISTASSNKIAVIMGNFETQRLDEVRYISLLDRSWH